MSLDNIQLQKVVLKELYKNNLVELAAKAPTPATKPAGNISILGKNKKAIIILVQDNENVYLPEPELNFLIGILTACQLSMEDVGVINTKRTNELKYLLFGEEIPAGKVLLFGVTPAQLQLPLEFPFYQLQNFHSITYLASPPLAQLMLDKSEKMKLWTSLKQLFNI